MEALVVPYLYYYTACLLYVLSALLCGVVRWFHMCRPYDSNPDYFYPGRRQAMFFYSGLLLQLPYLLWTALPDAWTYVRAFGVLYYPVCFSMLFLRYFRGEGCHKRLRRALLLILPLAWILFGFVQVVVGAWGGGTRWMPWQIGAVVVGAAYTVYHLRIVWWLRRKIGLYQQNLYSNDEDFPYRFAQRVLFIPIVWIMAMWVLFMSDSPAVKVLTDVLCSFMHVWLLVLILHPHWNLTPEQQQLMEHQQHELMNEIVDLNRRAAASVSPESGLEEEADASAAPQPERLTAEQKQALRERAIRIIREKELFLQPNLKMNDLAVEIHSNSTYLYKAFGQDRQQGSFYQVVNAMRVERCKELLRKNPDIDQFELMTASGFNSISTFYRVFKAFTGHTPKMWVRQVCKE